MPMTRAEADEILAQNRAAGGSSGDLDGYMRFHEALLLIWGWTDDEERAAQVQRVREAITSHRPE